MCLIGEFVKMRRVPKSKPIRAYRWWAMTSYNDTPTAPLRSWVHGGVWNNGALSCDRVPGRARSKHGIHAFRSWRALTDAAAVSRFHPKGSVYLWGIVAEHKNGYRAEHAKVCRLWRTK